MKTLSSFPCLSQYPPLTNLLALLLKLPHVCRPFCTSNLPSSTSGVALSFSFPFAQTFPLAPALASTGNSPNPGIPAAGFSGAGVMGGDDAGTATTVWRFEDFDGSLGGGDGDPN